MGLLGHLEVLLLLLNPVGGDLKHQALHDGKGQRERERGERVSEGVREQEDRQRRKGVWTSPSDGAGGWTSSSLR